MLCDAVCVCKDERSDNGMYFACFLVYSDRNIYEEHAHANEAGVCERYSARARTLKHFVIQS